jgi:hypothetical protein
VSKLFIVKPNNEVVSESLPASSFEMTLAGGWIFKDDLRNAENLDSTRGKLKETKKMEKNGKCTSVKRAVDNKKRTSAQHTVENKKCTAKGIRWETRNNTKSVPQSRRMRPSYDCKRNVRSSANSMIRTEKSCWWSFAPVWKLTLTTGPTLFSKSPTTTASALRRSVGTRR